MTGPEISAAQPDALQQAVQHLRDARAIVVMSGAGMSAESGIATFRGSHDSLWSQFDSAQLATVDAWRADPQLVWGWYLARMAKVRRAERKRQSRSRARVRVVGPRPCWFSAAQTDPRIRWLGAQHGQR